VELRWLGVLVVVALAAAAMLVYAAVRGSWTLPAVAVVVVAAAEVVNPAVLPAAVQRFVVDPQTLSRERPYITDAVDLTRRAYGLDRVADHPMPANATISARVLRANRDVLGNIQLWDTDVLRPEIAQQQAIGSYYAFPTTTVDRYRDGGRARAMILAERELDLRRLDPSGRTWANDHLAYSHGYGLVAVPAGDGGVDDQGKPEFVASEFGGGRQPTRLREPRLYFGVQPPLAEPWTIADSNRPEVERPLSGDEPAPDYHYDGAGGIPIPDLVRRGLFALRFGDLNLVLSETLGPLWGISFGSLYPALRRLERSGAIEETEAVELTVAGNVSTGSLDGDLAGARTRRRALPGRRTRKAYRVTPRGEAVFAELLADETADDERSFALKLSFCRHLDPAGRLAFLERRRSQLSQRLAKTRRSPATRTIDRYTRSLLEHRAQSTEHDLAWIDDLIAHERESILADRPEGATA